MRANSKPEGSPIASIFFQASNLGRTCWASKRRYLSGEMNQVDIQTTPTTIEKSDETAAPATPNGRPVTQPKIRKGASTMLMTTVTVDTSIVGLKLPTPRSAAPID